jgi:hypothetical protein
MDTNPTDTPTRKRLHEHISAALVDLGADALHCRPADADPGVWAATIGDHVEHITQNLVAGIVVTADGPVVRVCWTDRRGRLRTLVVIGLDRLADADGQPVDAEATVADLLVQLEPIPDDLSSLDDLPPEPESP